MNITNHTLSGGSYTLVNKPKSPLVIVHISADLGPTISVLEDASRVLFCDLLLSGAGTMSRAEFLDAVNEAGGSIAIKAHDGRLTVTIETIEIRLPKILSLVELMLTQPTFSAKEITRAKENFKKQLKVTNEKARAMALTNLIQSIYSPTDRYYQHTPNQVLTVVKNINKKQFSQIHQTFLNSYWHITIGSNHNAAKRVQQFLTRIHQNTAVSREENCTPDITVTSKFITHQISSQQNIEVAIGQRLKLTLTDTDYPAVIFALAVLGRWGGFSGRLMSTVREKEGLTYGIYARAEAGERDVFGHWRIMTFFHPKDFELGITSVLREINKIHRLGITAVELERFKTILKTNHTLLFDSLISLTNTVHGNNVKNLNFSEYEALLQQMQTLTVKEVNRAIKKYIAPEKLSYSLAGNLEVLDSQLKTLRSKLKL